jgi:hypothetical protein
MAIDGGCGNPDCGASSTILETPSFGRGELDPNGFWEFPCAACARAWEKLYPEDEAWPFREDSPIRAALRGNVVK